MTYNAEATIGACICSVISQIYNNIEYIIIDGASTDSTLAVIKEYENHINKIISEPDKGIYDAINKGIGLATGDIIGVLNADDFFSGPTVLHSIAAAFNSVEADILYGDLNYIDKKGNIVRKWRSGEYKHGKFNHGWMPPHPTFYCKKELFEKFGNYSLCFGTAADYELMLRFIHLKQAPVYYIKQVLVKMTVGGVSNSSYKNRIKALYYDLKAMYINEINFPLIALIFKPLRKLEQFL
ncbi:MAG: glycosyltransferase [Mucilaginibacter sp.]|nr:glycosyltransferase [Mucilaginibacter sp.]